MTTTQAPLLTYERLRDAVAGDAAAVRSVTRLGPAGGDGDKVFPPTYEGGRYATEQRRIGGRVVEAVLLDSVRNRSRVETLYF
jgi:CRISPR-associated protein Csb1